MHEGTSVQFIALNRGKRSVAVDLKTPEGRDLLLALVRTADVFVESFRPGVLARLGLAPELLSAENPRLVILSLSGYGQDGPYSHRAGHDLNYAALGGALATCGLPGGPPAPVGFQVADIGGALFGAISVLGALVARHTTGLGRALDVCLADAAVAFNALSLPSALAGQKTPRGLGLLDGQRPGYSVYEAADGRFLAVAPLEPKFWVALCDACERPDWKGRLHADPEKIRAELRALFATRTRDEWVARLAGVDACVEPVLELDELDGHPLHTARERFFSLVQGKGTVRQAFTPVGRSAVRPAPALGEHTDELRRELGLPGAQGSAPL